MSRKIKLFLAFTAIFILGLVAGAALMPLVMHQIAGNPYSNDILLDRAFNIKYLNRFNLTEDQIDDIDSLKDDYADDIRKAHDRVFQVSSEYYFEFMDEMKEILTPEQYADYRGETDKRMLKRDEWHKRMKHEGSIDNAERRQRDNERGHGRGYGRGKNGCGSEQYNKCNDEFRGKYGRYFE